MDLLRIIFTAVLPIAIIAFIIYRVDRFDREPTKLLIITMVLGALSVIPVLVGEIILEKIAFGGIFGIAFKAFIGVALVEEFFKRLVVVKYAYKKPAFNEPLDGIVYCVFAALGFAAIENIMYVLVYQSTSPSIAFFRGILSVPGHALFGVAMGYFLSMAKYASDPVTAKRYYRRSLWIPVLFHGIYDFILFSQMALLLLLFLPFVIYMWIYGIKKLKQFSAISKAVSSAD